LGAAVCAVSAVLLVVFGVVGATQSGIERPAPFAPATDEVQARFDAESEAFGSPVNRARNVDMESDDSEDGEDGGRAFVQLRGRVANEIGLGLKSKESERPRGIGPIALPRKDGTMTKVDVARKLWRERSRRQLKSGGMLRRYAPELFDGDIYGVDDNDNVKPGSRATIWDALNGPFAPLQNPSAQRPPINPDSVKVAMAADAREHAKLDKLGRIRHTEFFNPNDPTASAYTYLPKNHRNPFGYGRVFARARREQRLDIGPFDQPRAGHSSDNLLARFSKGLAKGRLPIPLNPRLPFAEAEAGVPGLAPSKLQRYPSFKPPPAIPKMAPPPNEDKSDNPKNGKGDTE